MGSFTASRLGLSLSFFCLALGALFGELAGLFLRQSLGFHQRGFRPAGFFFKHPATLGLLGFTLGLFFRKPAGLGLLGGAAGLVLLFS